MRARFTSSLVFSIVTFLTLQYSPCVVVCWFLISLVIVIAFIAKINRTLISSKRTTFTRLVKREDDKALKDCRKLCWQKELILLCFVRFACRPLRHLRSEKIGWKERAMLWSVEPLYAEDIESLAKRFQGIGSFSPSEAAAIGAARCGWDKQQTKFACQRPA